MAVHEITLQLSTGILRRASGSVYPALAAPPNPWAGFAAEHRARYAAHQHGLPHLRHTLIQPATRAMSHASHHHLSLSLSPRISLGGLTWQAASPPASQAAERSISPQIRIEQIVRLVPTSAPTPTAVLDLQTTQRLFVREQRVAAPDVQSENPIMPRPSATLPAMVVHRANNPSPDVPPPQPSIAGHHRGEEHPAVSRNAAQAHVVPTDINHLAEQVIRTIDQRIIARRERLGRI